MSEMQNILDDLRALSNYSRLSDHDKRRLLALAGKDGSTVLNGLYAKIGKNPELAAKITVPLDGIERRQLAHVAGLIGNPDSKEYLDRVDLIGSIHVRIGLKPEHYVAGYASIIADVVQAIGGIAPWSGRKTGALAAQFIRLAMIDMGLVLSVYNRGVQRQIEEHRQNQQLAVADDADKLLAKVFDELWSQTKELGSLADTLKVEAVGADEKSSGAVSVLEASRARLAATTETIRSFGTSLAEIGESASTAAGKASDVVRQRDEAREAVSMLVESAKHIQSVVGLIREIAEQTNLLALNATIEAARAGDAGRGFSVVAQEVKSLASQTAKATGEIAAQVNAMQTATDRAASQISAIFEAVAQMGGAVDSIVGATQGQSEAAVAVASDSSAVLQAFESLSSALDSSVASAAMTRVVAEDVARTSSEINGQTAEVRQVIRRIFAKMA